ncbi:DinB family protein [Desulfosporosinus nitroreducens]|uniref:DinB family protein n=1 Tax=Desulfosporosinus nitroreducens TaxID=2018668 RepID=UPI00207CA2DF|nr:DinB family protein [Desulfosporosinus nitroreducens]MCO1603586.1 DinB family protein [Desulfosporosinus nitroreducens]
MNKSHMIELYSYNAWANKKLLDAVKNLENEEFTRDLSSSFRSIRDTMVHILGAEELWLSRWTGEEGRTLLNPDDFPTYTTLADRWGDFRNQIDRFLVSLTEKDLLEEINYKNLSGISYSLELWKQMLHVNNHSTSHRGQVVTMLRQLKKQPPSLDLIYYYLGER